MQKLGDLSLAGNLSTGPNSHRSKGIAARASRSSTSIATNAQDAACKENVIEDKRCGPAEIATMQIDFAAWLRTLRLKIRRIAKTLASGETTGSTAQQYGVSPSRISQLRSQLKQAWHAFQDEPANATKSIPAAKAA